MTSNSRIFLCGATWAARTAGDLGLVLADLPHSFGPEPTGAMAIPGQAPVPSRPRPVYTDQSTRWTVAVLSGSRRKGRWRLRHQTNAVAIMGGCELDLRQAEVEGPEVVINAWAIMGGVDVIVPEGIAVELTGFGIMGGFNQAQAHAQFVSNIVDYGMNIQAAMEAARFNKASFAGCDLYIEQRVPRAVLEGLVKLGHQVQTLGDFSDGVGGGQAVMRDYKAGVNYGASDPRKDGAAIPEPIGN